MLFLYGVNQLMSQRSYMGLAYLKDKLHSTSGFEFNLEWNLNVCVFQKSQITRATSASAFWEFLKTRDCKLISNWMRKTWLLINILENWVRYRGPIKNLFENVRIPENARKSSVHLWQPSGIKFRKFSEIFGPSSGDLLFSGNVQKLR